MVFEMIVGHWPLPGLFLATCKKFPFRWHAFNINNNLCFSLRDLKLAGSRIRERRMKTAGKTSLGAVKD